MSDMASVVAPDPALAAHFFHGLSDASRVRILESLRDGEQRVSDVVDRTGLSQPNVSKHLRCLAGCGLVVREQRGREVFYTAADGLDDVLDAAAVVLARAGGAVAACRLTDDAVGAP